MNCMYSAPANFPNVALISLPWAPSIQPSIALGLLKSVLQVNNILCTCFYLENQFYNLLATKTETEKCREIMGIVTSQDEILYDWLFARTAFGTTKYENKYISRYLQKDKKYLELRKKFENLIETLAAEDWKVYDYIGFSCTFNQIISSLALSKRIKENYPEVKVIFGGAYFDPENSTEIIGYADWVNYIFVGEAENQLPLAIQLDYQGKSVEHVDGIMSRDKPICSTNYLTGKEFIELPAPNYDEYFSQKKAHMCGLEVSRGCWYGDKTPCAFCSMVPSASYRFDRKILDKILWLKSKYDIDYIEIADLVCSADTIELIFSNTAGLGIDFWVSFRVDTIQPRDLYKMKLLKQGRVKQIFIGIESLHPKLLKSIKKGHLAVNCINMLKWGKFYGIEMQWNLLYGIPSERPEYYDELLSVFKKITHLDSPVPIPLVISRGSDYAKMFDLQVPEAYNYIYPDEINLEKIAHEFKRASVTKRPSNILKFINLWSNIKRSASLTKLGHLIYDDRYADHRTTEISDEEIELLDYCQLPRKKRVLKEKFSNQTISRMIEHSFMIFSDHQYLTLIEPENDSIFCNQQRDEIEQFESADKGKKTHDGLHVL